MRLTVSRRILPRFCIVVNIVNKYFIAYRIIVIITDQRLGHVDRGVI